MKRIGRVFSSHASSQSPFAWKRVLGWALLIYVAISFVAFCFGLSLAAWHIYGATLEEAVATNRLIRMTAYWTTAALLYWRFARLVFSQRLLHVLVVFCLVEAIDVSVTALIFSEPLAEMLDPWATGRGLLAAIVGSGLASLGSNNSFKPKPLRGSA